VKERRSKKEVAVSKSLKEKKYLWFFWSLGRDWWARTNNRFRRKQNG